MDTAVICFIAGLSTAAFIAIWFTTAYRELAHAKQCVENAAQQLQLHKGNFPQMQGGPNEPAAAQSMDAAHIIHQAVVKNYIAVRHKPMNRIPAMLMGFSITIKEVKP